MVDTPTKPLPQIKDRRITFARIDPDGYVSATWRTWGLLGAMLVAGALFYAKLDAAMTKLDDLAASAQASREALIKAGLLSVKEHP